MSPTIGSWGSGVATDDDDRPRRVSFLMRRLFVQMSARWLLIITPAVLSVIVAASIYSSHQMRKLEQDAVSVATNGVPSIRYLSLCRDAIRHIEISTGHALGIVAQGRPPDLAFLETDEQQLRDQLKAFVALPFYPGERELYNRTVDDLHDFEVAADDVLDQLETSQLAAARKLVQTRLHPAADKANQSLAALINLSATQIAQSASRVINLRPRIERIQYLVQGFTALAMLLLMFLTWSSMRANQRLSEDRRQFAEERAQELEQFAGRVAHDLRNPLAGLSLGLEAARLSGERTAAQLHRKVQSMSKLIEGLLEFAVAGARPSPGASCRLEALDSDVLPMLRDEARHADVELAIAPLPSLAVRCTQGALASIVSNLVRNAIKFVTACPVRRVQLTATQRQDGVLIEIADTGPGIPEGELQRLFQPFVRLGTTQSAPGLGLGLTIVRRLVEGYGGRVGVRSTFGVGSTFWVELPIAPTPPADGVSQLP